MPREVTHQATGPVYLDESDIDEEKGDIAVCRCGLSDERPFCDGSHRRTEDEPEDGHYKYVDGERRRVVGIEFGDGDRLELGDGDRLELGDGDEDP